MNNVSINLIIFILFLSGIVWLQIFLSNKESKWYGRILPIITFLTSFIPLLSIVAFTSIKTINGVEKTTTMNISEVILIGTPIFIIYNIPTVILLVIYFACREKYKKKKQLDKMKIDDL